MEIKCIENKQTRNKIEMHARGVLTVGRGCQVASRKDKGEKTKWALAYGLGKPNRVGWNGSVYGPTQEACI